MEKKYFTKQQMKSLEDLNAIRHFDTVLDSGFKRGTPDSLNNAVADIYDEATGEKISRNFGCKVCCFNLYKKAGTLYRSSKAYYDAQQKIKMQKAQEAAEEEEKKDFPPDIEMKDGIITFSFERAEAEMEAPKTNKRTRKKKEDGNND